MLRQQGISELHTHSALHSLHLLRLWSDSNRSVLSWLWICKSYIDNFKNCPPRTLRALRTTNNWSGCINFPSKHYTIGTVTSLPHLWGLPECYSDTFSNELELMEAINFMRSLFHDLQRRPNMIWSDELSHFCLPQGFFEGMLKPLLVICNRLSNTTHYNRVHLQCA